MNATTPPSVDDLVVTATKATEAGWSVLLLGGDGKRPLSLWREQEHGYLDASSDMSDIVSRFEIAGGKCGGIGVVTGGETGPIVIDADGVCAVKWAEDRFGSDSTIPREKTSKGAHYFFAADPNIDRKIKAEVPDFSCTCGGECGVDVLGRGGYVAIAPSVGKHWVIEPWGRELRPLPTDILLSGASKKHRANTLTPVGGWGGGDEPCIRRLDDAMERAGISITIKNNGVRVVRCPGHDDHTPSAAYGYDPLRKKAWLRCHAGCDTPTVLRAVGLSISDLYDAKRDMSLTPTTYDDITVATIADALRVSTSLTPDTIGEVAGCVSDRLSESNQLSLSQVTMGVGKTRALAELVRYTSDNWLVNTSTHALAGEFEYMLADVQHTARSRGRREPTESEIKAIEVELKEGVSPSKIEIPDGVCMAMAPVVQVSEEDHFPAQALCVTCPYGLATMYDIYHERGWMEHEANIDTTLSKRGVDVADTLRCGYIRNQHRIKSARVVTQAGTGTSATQLQTSGSDGPGRRNLAIDETRPYTKRAVLKVEDIDGWIRKLQGQLAFARDELDKIREPESKVGKEAQARYDLVTSLCREQIPLLHEIRPRLLFDEKPDADVIWGYFAQLAEIDTRLVGEAKNTLAFERVRASWVGTTLDKLEAPRRAVKNIITAINAHCARIVPDRTDDTLFWGVEYYVDSGLLHLILEAAAPQTKILDATPSLGVQALVKARGGTIHKEIIPSPVAVAVNYTAVVGRGDIKSQEKRAKAAPALIERAVQTLAQALNCGAKDIAVLTHRPWAEACNEAGIITKGTKYWGAGEIAHNEWEDALGEVIAGGPYLPPAAMREAYHCDRAVALMGGADVGEWPWWEDNEAMEIYPQIKVRDTTVTWPGALPTNPILRRWVLSYYGQKYAQAIGRLRSIRSDKKQAVLVLGPVPDLSEYGITVVPIQNAPQIHVLPSPAERGAGQRAQADLRVVEALIALSGGGSQPTYANIRKWLAEKTGTGCGPRVIARVRKHLATNGISAKEYRAELVALIATAQIKGAIRHPRQDMPTSARDAINHTTHAYRRQDEMQRQRRKMLARQEAAHAPPALAS